MTGNFAPRRTIYKDVLYRSVTEARTAVFFDYAGINHKYEPELIELVDGTQYLPDFYLEDFKTFVEVKPDDQTIRDVERHKADLLASTGQDVWLTRGYPRFGYPWFEHIGKSQFCMIANDATHAREFWIIYFDREGYVQLSSGTGDRPCVLQSDIAIKMAASHAHTFDANQQEFAPIGQIGEMVLGDVGRNSF